MVKDNVNKGSELVKKMLYAVEFEISGTELNIAPVGIHSFLIQIKESYEMITKNKKIDFKAVRIYPIFLIDFTEGMNPVLQGIAIPD